MSSYENRKSVENIASTDYNKFQPSESLNTPSKILSKLEILNCEETVSLEKRAIDNAEYEKERILNMSVLYGYPVSKIRKITPKKASKFFKKTSLAIAVTKNIDFNRTNTEINFTATTVTANNNGNNKNDDINHINNHNRINNDNDNNDNHNINDDNNDNGSNDSECKNEITSIRSQNVKNDNNHYLNLMQYQSYSCHTHENNASKVTRTYDEYMFQAIDREISQQPHTNINSTALMTRSNLQTNGEISSAEIENSNENSSENANKSRRRSNDENKNEYRIVNSNDESRKVVTTNSCDSDNEVEVIVPYQTSVESTHTHADVHAHTRHVDRMKRVIERTEQQTTQKKRLVGGSKPFSRLGTA